jgi:peroxiredoxin
MARSIRRSRRKAQSETTLEFETMRKWILSLAGLALIASPVFAAGKYNKVLTIGEKAPGFDALPAVSGEQDTSVSLGDIKEDVIVVAFLANHCPAVVACEDRFIDLAKSFGDKSVKVVGISVTAAPGQKEIDDIAAIKKQVKSKGYNFVYAYDESQKTGKAYGAAATPTVIVLDKARNVRYMGALDDSTMNETKVSKTYVKDAVAALLAGKDVEVTETRPQGCGISYVSGK